VRTEIAERTWEFQRLSALSPWAMTWGKLLGATSLAWLCALTGAVIWGGQLLSADATSGLWTLANMFAIAFLIQGISLGGALVGVRKARAEGRVARSGGVLGGLVAGIFLLMLVAGSAGFQRGAGFRGVSQFLFGHDFIAWWGVLMPADVFRAVALACFAAWSVVGAWRLMRLELQMQNGPVVWRACRCAAKAPTAGCWPPPWPSRSAPTPRPSPIPATGCGCAASWPQQARAISTGPA